VKKSAPRQIGFRQTRWKNVHRKLAVRFRVDRHALDEFPRKRFEVHRTKNAAEVPVIARRSVRFTESSDDSSATVTSIKFCAPKRGRTS